MEKFKVAPNRDPESRWLIEGQRIQLKNLTDEQAQRLYNKGSSLVVKAEEAPAKPSKADKGTSGEA